MVRAAIDDNHHKGLIISDTLGAPLVLTGLDLTNANPAHVAIVDATGNQITSFGGGTQFAEDVAHTTGDVGTMALAVRNDGGAALAGTTGDYIPLTTDASGSLRVTGGGGGTEYTEDIASAADPVGNQVIARRRDTLSTETTTDGDNTALNSTGKGELYVKHVDSIPVTDNGGSLTVDGTVTSNAGTGFPSVQTEDAASAGGETGIQILGVRNDAAASKTSTDGDFSALATDAAGRVGIADLGGAISVDDNGGSLTIDAASLPLPTGASTLAEQQTQTTALQKLDNIAHSGSDVALSEHVPISGQFDDTATTTVTENQIAPVRITSARALHTSIRDALPAGTNNIGDVDVLTVPAPLSTSGGGTEASALRVTLANDSTGLVSVDDNGGSLTVDGSVSVTGTTTTSDTATLVDDAAFTPATSRVMMAGFEYDDTTPDSVNEGDAGAARMSANRNLYMNIRDSAGNERGVNVTAGNALTVDGSATTQPVSGTVTANAGTGTFTTAGNKTNNNAAPGATNVGALPAVSTASAPSYTEGNLVALSVDNSGALRTSASAASVSDATATGDLVATGSVTTATLNGADTATIYISGTWVATVQFEGTTDGTNYFSLNALPVTGGALVTSTTANGQWQINTGGLANLRARVSSYTSGTVAIRVRSSTGGGLVALSTPLPAGTNNIGDVDVLSSALPTGASTLAEQQTQTTALQLLDDTIITDNAAFTDGTTKTNIAGFIFDETAGTALTENDAAAARVDSKRSQVGVIEDATTRGQRASVSAAGALHNNIAQIGATAISTGTGASGTGTQRVVTATDSTIGTVTSVTQNADVRQATASNLNAQVVGAVAHDGADAGNPLKVGGKARTTNPTAVADADRVDATFDDIGRQVVVLNQVRDLETHTTTTISASTTETTILAAGGAGVFHDVTLITIANTSATATRVDIRDATAGSVVWSYYVPAGQTIGADISVPVKQTTANNAWTAQSSVSVTDLRIFIQAVKNV